MLKLRIWDRHSNSPLYFDICRDSYRNYLLSLQQWLVQPLTPETENYPIHPLPVETRKFIDLCRQTQKNWITSVVFGALCLESFIYDYATSVFSTTYVNNYLDGLNLKAKWVIIPKLVTGKVFPTDSYAFQQLGNLSQERNKLVHHKSKPMEPASEFTKRVREEIKSGKYLTNKNSDSLNPYQVVVEVLTELGKLDSDRTKKRCWNFEEE